MTVMDRLERCSSFECLAMILAAIPSYPIASAYTQPAQVFHFVHYCALSRGASVTEHAVMYERLLSASSYCADCFSNSSEYWREAGLLPD